MVSTTELFSPMAIVRGIIGESTVARILPLVSRPTIHNAVVLHSSKTTVQSVHVLRLRCATLAAADVPEHNIILNHAMTSGYICC